MVLDHKVHEQQHLHQSGYVSHVAQAGKQGLQVVPVLARDVHEAGAEPHQDANCDPQAGLVRGWTRFEPLYACLQWI